MSWSWTEKNANGDDDLKPFSNWLPFNENAFHPFVSFKQQCNQPNVGHWPHCPLHESMVPCQYSHTNFSYSFSLTYFWKSLFLGICEEFFKEQHSRTTGLETYVSSNHLCTPSPHSCLQKKKNFYHLQTPIPRYSQHCVFTTSHSWVPCSWEVERCQPFRSPRYPGCLSVDVFPEHRSALEPWIYHTAESWGLQQSIWTLIPK